MALVGVSRNLNIVYAARTIFGRGNWIRGEYPIDMDAPEDAYVGER